MTRLIAILLLLTPTLTAAWRAGVAVETITPLERVWMSGYGNRDRPFDGVAQELHAKALALEDPHGRRAVIVTTDLIGLSRPVAERIAARAHQAFGLSRSRLLLTSSHTHTGPALAGNLPLMQPVRAEDRKNTEKYTRWLEDRVVEAIGAALGDLTPAELSYHIGQAGFARNRRERTADGSIRLGDNPGGPVDHDVPVLKVAGPDGRLRAALFSYASHNTTLTGRHYDIHGDYAGESQAAFEREHPGAVALFMMGCGGDANPHPRGEMGNAVANGRELAAAAKAAIAGRGARIEGPLRAAFERFPIKLEDPPSIDAWRERLQSATGPEMARARYFTNMFERQGRLFDSYEYPLQTLRLGDGVTLIALAGEVVVDYALNLKRELRPERTWVVGYANDVMAYIPTAKILGEGGYEAEQSQVWYGMPSKWSPAIEETILEAAIRLARAP